eukprot:2752621-Pleurochrysis_carterae.AAC.1
MALDPACSGQNEKQKEIVAFLGRCGDREATTTATTMVVVVVVVVRGRGRGRDGGDVVAYTSRGRVERISTRSRTGSRS